MKKSNKHEGPKRIETKAGLEADVDALFKLPLAEFTGARNTLAARLKKSGRGDDAVLVKALVKPSISAWAVNQLYWNHREVFERLIASGERFHKAQTSRSAAKVADMREALDARRELLTQLSDFAASLLRDAGHNPAPDTIHRITTTLESISAYASRSDAPRPGRLTGDVDPPGFALFGSSTPAGMTGSKSKLVLVTPSPKRNIVTPKTRGKVAPDDGGHQLEDVRKEKIAAARVSLQETKKSLTQARGRAQSLEAALKRAQAEVKEAERRRRVAEETLEKARAASDNAARRVQSVAVEVEEAASALQEAERTVEKTSRELEELFRE